MTSDDSVTHWLARLEQGDSLALQAIWHRYFPKLVQLAQQQLQGVRTGAADEEDVALSALESFFDAAKQGRFENLSDRESLWRLLLKITVRKAIDLRRREGRIRRGGGQVKGESAVANAGDESEVAGFAQIVGDMPTPEFAAMMAEQCQLLLSRLEEDDPTLRTLAVARMEGYTNEEIARRLDCVVRTVERRLHRIRKIWEHEGALP